MFTFPEPSAGLLHRIYNSEYRFDLHRFFSSEKTFRANKLVQLLNFKGVSTLNTKVLELGAGNCELSSLLHLKYDFNVTAVDWNITSNGAALKLVNSSIENFLETNREKYDYVFISHTLEHLYEFTKILKKICLALNHEGLLIIVVPNAVKRKKHWGYWAVPVHLFHFTENFFKHFAIENSLEIQMVKFKSIDTLGFLAGISAKMGLKKEIRTSKIMFFFLRLFSFIFRFGYHFGNSDLIFIAKKR
jgi:SAM-dependent methyltransferase